MRKLLLIASLLCSQSVVNCTGGKVQDQALIHFASDLEGAIIRHDGDDNLFYIFHDNKEIQVQNCFVDPLVRNCTNKYLISFFENNGYLIVKLFDDGEPYIKAKMRLNGGFVLCMLATLGITYTGLGIRHVLLYNNDDDYSFGDHYIKMLQKKNQVFIDKLDIAVTEVCKKEKLHDEKLIENALSKASINKDDFINECIVGPGIPIGPLPFPAPRLPYPSGPADIIRQPQPIPIGGTILV